jgi:hypothetical protein
MKLPAAKHAPRPEVYRSAAGDLILKVWRNSKFYRAWRADEATLRAEANANRRLLEADGWEAL